MEGDMSLEQVKRMRQWIIEQSSDHAMNCNICAQLQPCSEMERLVGLLRSWSFLDIGMQQARLNKD